MREIKWIVIHCTASPATATTQSLINYWRNVLKWKANGYHILIHSDGRIEQITPENEVANGVAGYNKNAIHVSWVGGHKTLDITDSQWMSLEVVVRGLKAKFPNAEIKGHRDFEGVSKSCPRFDVKTWLIKANI
jgi:N-acetylmuramoyl-L-alanine amidase